MNNNASTLVRAEEFLKKTKEYYEEYEARRPDSFNVFTVLYRPEKEVMHTRFLHALLDPREPGEDEKRRNLEDFLKTFVKKDFDISYAKVDQEAKVHQEKDRIDLLIINQMADPPWAVVIENKIRGPDQKRQLEKYHQHVEKLGISTNDIHILYLTLDGREPPKSSAGKFKGKCICVSYEDILPWLKTCQRQAGTNARLHESIAQYMEVVRGLTGLYINEEYEEYMEKLKDLCLEDDDNFRLIHDLKEAYKKVCIDRLVRMWEQIKEAMDDEFKGTGILEIGPDSRINSVSQNGNVAKAKIENIQTNGIPRRHGLYYPLGKSSSPDKNNSSAKQPSIVIELEGGYLWYGIECDKEEDGDRYCKIRSSLEDKGLVYEKKDYGRLPFWRWAKFENTRLHLRIGKAPEQWLKLNDKSNLEECAQEIARELKEIWEKLPDDLKQNPE
ncbi:MAG: hypothetical protein F4Y00_04340 [Bacteroidetes bacterium SB0662_bin_6]|nr:hypothetical protein [Bacteroidetes bacterium SB0668_bin_1]MYE04184.1 hypothetical protein [Bacteroidetes bacterium SB0662_bin_6]